MATTDLSEHVNPLGFGAFLKEKKRFTQNTIDTYVSAARRAMRALSLEDMMDGAIVQAYRCSLPRGTRNTFDAAWPFFSNFAWSQGFEIPGDLPGKPRIRYASPLLADLITLTSYPFSNDTLPARTWRDLLSLPQPDRVVLGAAVRIWQFQYNSLEIPDPKLNLDYPLAPVGPRPDPMKTWQIEWAINTESDLTAGHAEQGSAKFIYALAAARANGVQLRQLYRLYILSRNRVQQHGHGRETIRELIDLATPQTLPHLEKRLLKLADEEEAHKLPLW